MPAEKNQQNSQPPERSVAEEPATVERARQDYQDNQESRNVLRRGLGW